MNLCFKSAVDGIKQIQQYSQGDTRFKADIERVKKICDEFCRETSINTDSLTLQQMEKINIIDSFYQDYTACKNPFAIVKVNKHGFDRATYGPYYGCHFIYSFTATIINQSNKQITDASLMVNTGKKETTWIGKETDIFDYPKIEIVFKDKTIISTTRNDLWQYGGGDISTQHSYFEPKLDRIHFDYVPESCTISIPFTVRDPVGYVYTTYFKYDILDDWKEYAKSIKK